MVAWLLGSLIATGCGSDAATAPGDRAPAFLGTVSEPVATPSGVAASAGGVGGRGRGAATSIAALDRLAFVSLAPGVAPDGTRMTIGNRRTGESISAAVVDGGVDPVGIAAIAGDTLDISIALSSGGVSLAKSIVPASRPPRIVRTSPPKGRTDVAINATMAVIFSEPIDPASLDDASVRLLQGGVVVAGALRPIAGSNVGIEFVPAAPLLPATEYQLVVSDAVKDLSGDRLQNPLTSDFATAGGGEPGVPPGQSNLVFTAQPADAAAFARLAPAVQVTVLDASGRPDSSFSGEVIVELAANPGGATLLGTRWLQAINGVATFTDLTVTRPGSGYTLSAGVLDFLGSASPYRVTTSATFTVAPGSTSNSWVMTPPPPTRRLGAEVVVANGILYLIGGTGYFYSGTRFDGTVYAYDPATATWATRAPMPSPRSGFSVGVMNGKLYAVGGETEQNLPLAIVNVYDPATNTWTTAAPMPTPRSLVGVGVVNGKLYAVGGTDRTRGAVWYQDVLATVEAYDPLSNTWSRRAAMPTRRDAVRVGVVAGTMYAVGGIGADGGLNYSSAVEAYDPLTDSWSARASARAARAYDYVGNVAGRLHFFGGDDATGSSSTVDAYDPAADSWSAAPPLPEGGSAVAGIVNGVMYLVDVFPPSVWDY